MEFGRELTFNIKQINSIDCDFLNNVGIANFDKFSIVLFK